MTTATLGHGTRGDAGVIALVSSAHGVSHFFHLVLPPMFPWLREAFGLDGLPPSIEQVVVTRFEGERAGIAVDQVLGQQQTVIKSLGNYIGSVAGISGATINGDGTMSLILDVPSLVASVKRVAA